MLITKTQWSKAHLTEAVKFLKYQGDISDIQEETPHTVLEFGVWKGQSCGLIAQQFQNAGLPLLQIFGFDSFQGLPEEKQGIPRWSGFHPKAFGNVGELENNSLITYIKSWFSELGPETVSEHQIKRASLVHIDCDLYISAYQALDFIFANKLVGPGSVIAYDEFRSLEHLEDGGESKAHLEITKKYGVKFKEFFRNTYENNELEWWQNCFVVEKVNAAEAAHGIYNYPET